LFEFENPSFFVLLLLILCIYKCPATFQTLIFPHTHLFTQKAQWINKEKLLYSLILALLVSALASPIHYKQQHFQKRKGRDLIFVVDTSGSMAQSGYSKEQKNKTKFDILKNLIADFILHRFDDNVGVSVFGSYAFSSVPLTYDMNSVAFLLNFLEVGIAGENTAIGDGIFNALTLLDKGEAKNKVIILITDGDQNSGRVSIQHAVQKAQSSHVKIYTIGIGKKRDFDTKLLEKIASQTGAKMFQARNKKALQAVYEELDSLEPSDIHAQHNLNKQMLFSYPLAVAILLLLYLVSKRKGVRDDVS
jgi:Ca-activated chloride channel family protein